MKATSIMCLMRTFDADATRAALPFAGLIEALRAMFTSGCEVPLRHTHVLPGPEGGMAGTVLIMPAWQPGRYLGIKTVNVFPGNAAQGLPGLHATYILYDATTGVPLAMMDGDEITARRTAAASALAASLLAPRDAQTLLIVGAGRVARLLPQAYQVVRPDVRRVLIWNRTLRHAVDLVRNWHGAGIEAEVVEDLAAAAGQADIVSCATLSRAPLIQGLWLRDRSHLDLIGSFAPDMRESDLDCLRGAQVYVDTDEALRKSGDLLAALQAGVLTPESVHGTLTDLCRGGAVASGSASGRRTVFKSVGTALEDLAAAVLVYESAARRLS